MIGSKTDRFSALERLFRPQNGHCKNLQVASGSDLNFGFYAAARPALSRYSGAMRIWDITSRQELFRVVCFIFLENMFDRTIRIQIIPHVIPDKLVYY